jgi:hypothetical protein
MPPDSGGVMSLRPFDKEKKAMFKPNYGQQRADRQRAQNARREQKLKEQQEATTRRRAAKAEAEAPPASEPHAE